MLTKDSPGGIIGSETRTGGVSVQFEYSRLRGKIREVFGTEASFAKALGMGRVSLSQRLNNALEFSATEIRESCLLLGISSEDIPAYFFAEKVQKHEQDAE